MESGQGAIKYVLERLSRTPNTIEKLRQLQTTGEGQRFS